MRFAIEGAARPMTAVPAIAADYRDSNIIDLSERFAARVYHQPPELDCEAEDDFQARVDRLLAEKPPQWPEFVFWGLVSSMFAFGVFGVCACLLG